MWISPSMPGSTSANAPNSMIRVTLTVICVPDGQPLTQRVPRAVDQVLQAERQLAGSSVDRASP